MKKGRPARADAGGASQGDLFGGGLPALPAVVDVPAVSEDEAAPVPARADSGNTVLSVAEPPPTFPAPAPAASAQSNASGDQFPASGAQPAESGAQRSVSGAQSSASGAQVSATGTPSPASGAQASASRAQSSASGAQPSVPGAQSSASGTQSFASGAPSPASGSQPAESGAQRSVPGAQSSASGAQLSAPGAQPLSSGAPSSVAGTQASVRPDLALPASGATVTAGAAKMLQPLPPKPQKVVLSVGELTRQIKGTLERGFTSVTVRGEVTGFRGANARGHLYFSLKDADACIDTKVWASLASRMKFKLRDGLELVVDGSVDVYEPQGRYSLIVSRIEPAGEGALALAFQQLKERLMAEGLFGDKRVRPPRPIPFLPRRIGVVTSVTGAALRDFIRVLHARHPKLSVLVADARVQGDGAAAEVARGIQRLARTDVDVIVVTRGGGSIEDLWTFNEEQVARAIFASPIPVVSAIGHEVDYTIADFVADYRAPTPSAAAEKLAPVLRDLELTLRTQEGRLRKAVERHVLADRQRLERLHARLGDPRRVLGHKRLHLGAQADKAARCARVAVRGRREQLKALSERLARQHPQTKLAQKRQELAKLAERLRAAMGTQLQRDRQKLTRLAMSVQRASPAPKLQSHKRWFSDRQARLVAALRKRTFHDRRTLHGLTEKLNAMSPLAVLARGYSVTFRAADGHVVRSADEVKPGDALAIRLAPGGCTTLGESDEIDATVTNVRSGRGK